MNMCRPRRSSFDRGKTGHSGLPIEFVTAPSGRPCTTSTVCSQAPGSRLGSRAGSPELLPELAHLDAAKGSTGLLPMELQWALPSIFASDPSGSGSMLQVSEGCLFNAREQEQLLTLRRRTSSCLAAFEGLKDVLAEDGPAALAEAAAAPAAAERAPPAVQEVQQQLCNERFLQRMRDYIVFIDAALAGQLEPAPAVKPKSRLDRALDAGTMPASARSPTLGTARLAEGGAPLPASARASSGCCGGPSKTPGFKPFPL